MNRVDPASADALGELAVVLGVSEQHMGFRPNSQMTMARVPGLLEAFLALGRTIAFSGLVPPGLTQLVAHVTSNASGCRYCQAHTAHAAARAGVDDDKIAAAWDFERSDLFSAPERAALRLAFNAGQVPNAVTDDDFALCREYFDDEQITAIVAVCSLFGFLNRWNDTMATQLEDGPLRYGLDVLGPGGWEPGRHVPQDHDPQV